MTEQSTGILIADPTPIRACWRALVRPGDVHEVRIPKSRKDGPLRFYGPASGYFNDEDAFVEAVAAITGADAEGVYVTLNPVDSALLARANNRLISPARTTTADQDITRRWNLLIDIDPVRPSGISATEAEQARALAVRDAIRDYLADLGWPQPVVIGATGNGGGLIYRLDLPDRSAER